MGEEEEDGAYISLASTPTTKMQRRKQNLKDRKIREARALAQSKRMEEEEDSEDQQAYPLETDEQDEEEEDVTSAYGKSESFAEEEEDEPSDSDEDELDEHLSWQQAYKNAKNKAKKMLKDPKISSGEVTAMHDVLKNIWGDNKQMYRTTPFGYAEGEDPEGGSYLEDATEAWIPVWDALYRRYNKTKPKPLGKSKSGRRKTVSKKAGGGSNPLNT